MEELDVKSKYYTPSVEEFRIGFEYERCDDGYKYFKDIFPRNVDQSKLENYLPYFRVKYLDSEDIESLGFNFISESKNEISHIRTYSHESTGNNREFNFSLLGVPRLIFKNEASANLVLTIKNKSELIQILKMVGIL